MTSELTKRPIAPAGVDLRDWRPGAPARNPQFVIIGLGAIVSLILVGFAAIAGPALAHGLGAALFSSSHGQNLSSSAVTTASLQSLEGQSTLVERRRAAVATYAAKFTEFKIATARPPGAVGINLSAAEARRRDDVLAGLVLQCIEAVGGYNLAAQAISVTQLQSSGLPERFVWAVDCASEP